MGRVASISQIRGKKQLSSFRDSSSSAGEPYLVTPRTMANVESSLGGYLDERPSAVVRGWLFDSLKDITRLQFTASAGHMGVVVHSIERPDVAAIFPRYRYSLESGFTLFVYLDPAQSTLSSLQFSYEVRGGGEVHGTLPLPRLTWAISGAAPRDERLESVPLETDVVIVAPLHSAPERALLHAVMREVGLEQVSVTCIGGPASEGALIEAMGPYQHKGPPVLFEDYARLAVYVSRFRACYRALVLLRPQDLSFEHILFPTLFASANLPPIILLDSSEHFVMPAFLGGYGFKVLRWPSRSFPAAFKGALAEALMDL